MSISKFDLAKALRNQAKIVADANSITLVGNGEGFSPDVNLSHIEEIALFGDDNTLGHEDTSSDMQVGVYQLSVHTPKIQTKWEALRIIDILQASFVKGLELTFNGQLLRLRNGSISTMDQNETHLIFHLSIVFTVIN